MGDSSKVQFATLFVKKSISAVTAAKRMYAECDSPTMNLEDRYWRVVMIDKALKHFEDSETLKEALAHTECCRGDGARRFTDLDERLNPQS